MGPGQEDMIEIDNNILMIVGDPQGIIDQQLIIIIINYIELYNNINYFLKRTIPSKGSKMTFFLL